MLEKKVYPVVITYDKEEKTENKYLVYIPDFETNTYGNSLSNAIEMARDAIGLSGISLVEDLNQPIPQPDTKPYETQKGDIVTLVDIDFEQYKRAIDATPVKKTLSIPRNLNELGLKAGINFSQTLTEALHQKLGV